MASTGAGILLARGLSLALFILSARTFSVAENASFIFGVTGAQLLVAFGTVGWLPLIRQKISLVDRDRSELVNGFIRRSFQIPLLATAIICLALIAYGYITAAQDYFVTVAVLTLLFTLQSILREYIVALNRPTAGILLSEAVPLAIGCGGLWLLRTPDVPVALAVLACGAVVSLALQLCLVVPRLKGHLSTGIIEYDTKGWMRYGLFALVGTSARRLLDRIDVIVLSAFAMSAPLALYNSGMRVASLLLLPPIVLLPVFSPHVSRSASSKDFPSLRRDMLLQTLLVALAVLPFAGAILAFPGEIMEFVFGESYGEVSGVVGFMVMSQIMFAFSLPWSNLYLMKNGETVYAWANLMAAIFAFAMAFALAGTYSALAVAIASMLGNTLLMLFFWGFGTLEILGEEGK